MKLKNWLIPATTAIALGFVAIPAQSAPVGGVTGGLASAAAENAGAEQVHYRYRYYRHHRHHRHHYYYGYGPGIYLNFGHRRHHHHHRRHWGW